MSSKKVDTSLETAREVVKHESRNSTDSISTRNLAFEILEIGFRNQFEEDREPIRRNLDELITSVATAIGDSDED